MADSRKRKGFFRNLLSGNSSRPTLLRGDHHERGVMGSARRAGQEEAARHNEAQQSSTLQQVRTRFDDQASSLQSSWGVSSDNDDANDVEYQGAVLRPVDWTVVQGPTGNSHVLTLVLQAHLSAPDIVTLIMSRHGGAGAHNPLERTGWSHPPSPGGPQIRA